MREARRLQGRLLSLSYVEIPGRKLPAAACVVSSKTISRAAGRNRVKRRCREVLVPLLRKLQRPFGLVVHIKRPAEQASQQELKSEITSLIRRAGSIL